MHLQSKDATIYVAGHRGMVGQAVCRRLEADGYDWIGRTSSEVDLRDQAETRSFFEEARPDFVVLAAATVGGILANDTYPADFLYNNTAIATNVIQAAHETDVDRLIFLGSSCIYPKHAPQPMREEHLLTGPLEPTNQWYAVAKIAGLKHCEALHRQHGDDFLSLMPTNLYGIGDDFDLETSHVLPALLRKVHEAKGAAPNGEDAPVTMWGTGTPKREFLFVDDLADAVVHVLHQPEDDIREVAPDGLLNVGVGEDLSINDLMATIKDVVGSESPVEHDLSKPDGTPRKLLDVSRMQSLGWEADTALREGIRQTYAWYREQETQPAGR
jgi:GDP-L-fucose synthase